MRQFPLFMSGLLALMIASCSHVPPTVQTQDVAVLNASKADLANTSHVKRALYLQYQEWKGTRHTLGGLSKRGIDCSGLVYTTYREKLGIAVPRTTQLQLKVGRQIDRRDLRAGDLVFFKTGYKSRHVGIYIENNQFLHVSSKKGVMISKLSDDYWKEKYWQSRRVKG